MNRRDTARKVDRAATLLSEVLGVEQWMIQAEDPVIWRPELQRRLEVCSETIRRYLKDGKLPPEDVFMSLKKRGWRLSTLRAHGINLG